MHNIKERIAMLSPEKRALLERRLEAKAPDVEGTRIQPRTRNDEPLPLTFAQERLWFLDQYQPGNPMYNLLAQYRIPGALDASALERSLGEIVRRHESLRTTFSSEGGRPVQNVHLDMKIPLHIVDLRDHGQGERIAQAQRIAVEEGQQPFDLSTGPLLRATLFRLGAQDYLFVLLMHHIVSDGWSMGVFLRELSQLYEAYSMGRRSSLPDPPIQYPDFALWQRHYLQGEVLDSQLAYWRKQLDGAPEVLVLPTDRPRLAKQTFAGAMQSFALTPQLSIRLKELGQCHGATLFMVLLAAYQTLLWRYTERDDLVVGSSIANRGRAEIDDLIGLFVNILALRTNMAGNPSFLELLERVRQVTLEAFSHQEVPFEKLVEELRPERSLSFNPLVQVMFDLQNAAQPGQASAAVANPQASDDGQDDDTPQVVLGTSKFDLTLYMTDGVECVTGAFEYNTDLFKHDTISRMIGHLKTLLTGITTEPGQRLSQLPLLSSVEQQKLLVQWTDSQRQHGEDVFFHQHIETLAKQRPDAVALLYDGADLSYQQLNHRANGLARTLMDTGVGCEQRVGVCMERAPEAFVALLAILKCGAVYVPIDPSYPHRRVAFMLNDAGVELVLTERSALAALSEYGGRVQCLDDDWEGMAPLCAQDPDGTMSPDSLAYVIYTSGSTGRPKGVMITHRAMCNAAEFMVSDLGVRPDSRTLQFSSLSFDASFFECLMTLGAGATLCLPHNEALMPGPALVSFLREHRITNLVLMPSVLAMLPEEQLPEVRTIIVGGEPCPVELARRWTRGRRFFNGYGPTEATVLSTVADYSRDRHLPPVVGTSIANAQIYLLNRYLTPVPIGVPGEVYIGGTGVARGYLGRPMLTAERFVPNPFDEHPGARLYKTGDLARYRADGNLEFLGRIDDQVKIRGFRIELGEVEAVLGEHPKVHNSVVVLREHRPSHRHLVAYVICKDGESLRTAELRNHLKTRLPGHMIPAMFIPLETLPLSPNGKLDRTVLDGLVAERTNPEGDFMEPRDDIERRLAEIWSDVLGIEQLGVDDDFFELGGHSLMATQVISRVRSMFDIELPLYTIFERSSIAELAATMRDGGDQTRSPAGDPIRRADEDNKIRNVKVEDLPSNEVDAMLAAILGRTESKR